MTGEILTVLGSRDYFREDIEGKNNNVTALNSPGSSFKPFVYMSSFMKLGWGPGTYILDTPVSYKQIDGTEFVPTNPGKNFKGLITLRSALGNSLNIPANKVADATGIDFVVQTAKKMGITTLTGRPDTRADLDKVVATLKEAHVFLQGDRRRVRAAGPRRR